MKNIELLPISPEAQKRLSQFALQYRRNARIYIEVVSFDGRRLIVRVEQKELVNGRILAKTELIERVKSMFEGEVPADWVINVSAANFDRKDIANVDHIWIATQMERLELKAKHLVSHTGIDKSTISTLLSGDRELTKWQKVAFYYLFKHYEFGGF